MSEKKAAIEELWAKQQISAPDVDYNLWNRKRKLIKQSAENNPGCIFTVDVFKGIYDFASDNFARIFGYNPNWIRTINKQGDLLEENIHPDDREQIADEQIRHSDFIYSLPFENRNDYSTTYQFRMLNRKKEYINIISRQQIIQKDRNGKAWIVMGIMDIAPDQVITDKIKYSVLNLKTGDVFSPSDESQSGKPLTAREKEILCFIRQGLLTKEIALRLGLSTYTVSNHRKNILAKLNANNSIEAINQANSMGL